MQYHGKNTSIAKKITVRAIFATLALIFSYVEFLIPYDVTVPGVKLGLANLVIIIALYETDFRSAMSINLVRIILSGFLFSGINAMLYSLGGGILSLSVMGMLRKTNKFSMIGVSMAGGVFHNLGQLLVAAFMVSNIGMLAYMSILTFTGIASGIMIGTVSYIIGQRIPKQLFQLK